MTWLLGKLGCFVFGHEYAYRQVLATRIKVVCTTCGKRKSIEAYRSYDDVG